MTLLHKRHPCGPAIAERSIARTTSSANDVGARPTVPNTSLATIPVTLHSGMNDPWPRSDAPDGKQGTLVAPGGWRGEMLPG